MQKIKNAVKNIGHHGDRHGHDAAYDNTYNTTGTYGTTNDTYATTGTDTYGTTGTYGTSTDGVVERPVGVGVAEVPVVVTEQERVRTEGHVHERVGEEVCGTKTFTEVEDRPIVKERVERYIEHQPVEKQYVVETKFVGEKGIPSATGATVIDTNERVVERAEPGPACPVGTGAILDETVNAHTHRI